MRLLSTAEFDIGAPPSAEDIRAWSENPVTERMFNTLFNRQSQSIDAAERNGFNTCRDYVLYMMTNAATVLAPAVAPGALPDPDYDAESYITRRHELLYGPKV